MRLPVPSRRGPATDDQTQVLPAVRASAAVPAQPQPQPQPLRPARRPFYVRLLHLRHIAPSAWQRALLGEGSLALAGVLVLADLATAWTLLVLPLAVAAMVKAHDLLARLLGRPVVPPPGPRPEKVAGSTARVLRRTTRSTVPRRTNGAGP